MTRTAHRSAGGSTVPFLSVGQSALALFERGDPYVGGERQTGVHHIALAVDDVAAARQQIAACNLAFEADGSDDGIDGRQRALLSLDATNGIRTYLTGRIDRPEGKRDFVDKIDHLGIIGTDNARVVDTYCTKLGCTLDGEQFDTELQTSTEHFVYKSQGKTKTVVYTRPTEFVAAVHDALSRPATANWKSSRPWTPTTPFARPATRRETLARTMALSLASWHSVVPVCITWPSRFTTSTTGSNGYAALVTASLTRRAGRARAVRASASFIPNP